MLKKANRDLTEGSITRGLILFALPFLFSSILQAAYNISDTFIISRFIGKEGVAATHSGGQIMTVCINVATGLSMGGTVVVSRFFGAKDKDGIRKSISSFFLIIFAVAALLTLVLFLFSDVFLRGINTPPEVMTEAKEFLQIYSVGVLFLFGYNGIFALFRGMGNSQMTLMFVALSTVANFVMDLVMVVWLGGGTREAALSTTISIILCFVASLIYFIRKRGVFYLSRDSLRPDWALCKRILLIGLPGAVQSSVFSISLLFMTSFINIYGVSASAASAIGAKVDSLFLLPFQAVSAAGSAMISQNIGANKELRVRKTLHNVLGISFSMAVCTCILSQLAPETLMRFFADDSEVIRIGALYLRIVAINHLLVSILNSFNSLAIGAGNTVFPLCLTVMNAFVFRIPIGMFFERILGMGLSGVFMGFGLANIGGAVAGYLYYRFGNWRRDLRAESVGDGVGDVLTPVTDTPSG